MSGRSNIDEWLAQRAKEHDRLYELYGKSLEKEHTGEYAAIASDGRILFGSSTGDMLRKGVMTFGSGNFSMFRIGYPALEKWSTLFPSRTKPSE